jgi:hypothetical protein
MTDQRRADTVLDRFESLQTDLTPVQIGAGVALGVALAFALLALQEPVAHDAMHNFRHAAGITCH